MKNKTKQLIQNDIQDFMSDYFCDCLLYNNEASEIKYAMQDKLFELITKEYPQK